MMMMMMMIAVMKLMRVCLDSVYSVFLLLLRLKIPKRNGEAQLIAGRNDPSSSIHLIMTQTLVDTELR
uniref:Putative secreted protein n=1 Tax=Anopheles darlingi TaxID=43151 RepID=A0A2M4DGE2_ANODA